VTAEYTSVRPPSSKLRPSTATVQPPFRGRARNSFSPVDRSCSSPGFRVRILRPEYAEPADSGVMAGA
jgi:hypothetical protein